MSESRSSQILGFRRRIPSWFFLGYEHGPQSDPRQQGLARDADEEILLRNVDCLCGLRKERREEYALHAVLAVVIERMVT